MYKDMSASLVTDIRNVICLIGRVKTRGKWGIVDRRSGMAAPVFDDAEEDSEADWLAGSRVLDVLCFENKDLRYWK